jgi:hypothetical protein
MLSSNCSEVGSAMSAASLLKFPESNRVKHINVSALKSDNIELPIVSLNPLEDTADDFTRETALL